MQKQQLFGIVVIVLILVGIFWFFRETPPQEKSPETQEVAQEDVGETLSAKLGVTIPDDVQRTTLKDLRGEGSTGIATRSYRDGLFSHTILAALPELTTGTTYHGWLVRGSEGDENYSVISTGALRPSKGGYLLEYSSSQDLEDHIKVWVTVEAQDDNTPETKVLEGQF